MATVIPLWDIPSLPVQGSADRYPVRRIFCVGRNYVEHQKEMGSDGREIPFFFIKSAHSLVAGGGDVHYPAKTANYHYETELVVALGKVTSGLFGGPDAWVDVVRRTANRAGDRVWPMPLVESSRPAM